MFRSRLVSQQMILLEKGEFVKNVIDNQSFGVLLVTKRMLTSILLFSSFIFTRFLLDVASICTHLLYKVIEKVSLTK